FAEDDPGGLAGDLFHFGDQAAQFALVGDPFGVAGGLAGGEPGGHGLAGDFAGELVVGSVRLGRFGLGAGAGLAAAGVAAGGAPRRGGGAGRAGGGGAPSAWWRRRSWGRSSAMW